MKNSPMANSLSISVRIYRALLVAYPKKFREHYETQLMLVFRDSLRDEYHHNGMPGVIDLWIHTWADLLVTALVERLMERSQYMFSPKVILWGGLAGVFSGLFWLMMGFAPESGGAAIVLALVLGLGGLAALYSLQAGQGGRLGLAGFALGILGTVLALAALWWGFTSGSFSPSNLHREPVLAVPAIITLILGMVITNLGLVLLGMTNLRVKTSRRWRGLPLGVGLLSAVNSLAFWKVYYVPLSQGRDPWETWPPEGYVLSVAALMLLGLGWMVLGAMLTAEGDAQIPVAQPPSASA